MNCYLPELGCSLQCLQQPEMSSEQHPGSPLVPHGVRVRLPAGSVRVEIEALLSMGLPNSPMAGADIRVASGNFVTAKPLGVRNGVDLQLTGAVRKIDAEAIQRQMRHTQNDLLERIRKFFILG